MKPVKLSDLIPQKAEIELNIDGESRVFTLRPKNLEDDAWISEKWGDSEAIQKVFQDFELPKIAKLLFRLVSPKEPLAGKTVKVWTDDGVEVSEFKPGWKILLSGIAGKDHMLKVINALMLTWGISEPLSLEDNGKKKQAR